MNKNQKSELGVGVTFFIFGIYIFYEGLKLKGKESLGSSGALFPLVIASIIVVLSFVIIIRTITEASSEKKASSVSEEPTQSLWNVAVGLIILIGYFILLPRIGFLLSTVPFLIILMYFMKMLRKKKKIEVRAEIKEILIIILTSFVVAFSAQIVFKNFFRLPLP